jgi:hypothetical protein
MFMIFVDALDVMRARVGTAAGAIANTFGISVETWRAS